MNTEESFDLNILDKNFISKNKIVLLILNRPITHDISNLVKISNSIICADGGADYFLEKFDVSFKIPNIIIGDFDSLSTKTKETYKSKGVEFIERLDPGISDYEKCLYLSIEKASEFQTKSESDDIINTIIIVIGASGGRIDHTFNIYQISCKYMQMLIDTIKLKIYLIGDSSLSILLDCKDDNTLYYSEWNNKNKGYSLLPLNCKTECLITEITDKGELQNNNFTLDDHSYYFKKSSKAAKICISFSNTKANDYHCVLFNVTMND